MYHQNLDFTCGPACLVSVLQKSFKQKSYSILDEIQIWKESNTIFMGEGHPGTCPYGLALSATKRGLYSKVVVSDRSSFFAKSVQEKQKQSIVTAAQNQMKEKAMDSGISVSYRKVDFDFLHSTMNLGYSAIVLVNDCDSPHWILANGSEQIDNLSDPAIKIFDPWHERGNDLMYRSEFERIGSWEGVSCCVLLLGSI